MSDTETTPQKTSPFKKILGWLTVIVVAVIAFAVYWRYYNVFGDGVKSGQLNFVVRKGNIFKTYEGKLIQNGLRSPQTGTVQSYEFDFSVENDSIANVLMNNSGASFDLHYKQYRHTLPWRGYTPYIVDKIVNMVPEQGR